MEGDDSGLLVGPAAGLELGVFVGDDDGLVVGPAVVGLELGDIVGKDSGVLVGLAEGERVGNLSSAIPGDGLGLTAKSCPNGLDVGNDEGPFVGFNVMSSSFKTRFRTFSSSSLSLGTITSRGSQRPLSLHLSGQQSRFLSQKVTLPELLEPSESGERWGGQVRAVVVSAGLGRGVFFFGTLQFAPIVCKCPLSSSIRRHTFPGIYPYSLLYSTYSFSILPSSPYSLGTSLKIITSID